MILATQAIQVIDTHLDKNIKSEIASNITETSDIKDVFIELREKVVLASLNDITDEKTTAIASMTGMSDNDECALEDLTIGVKYINKYWSKDE